MSEKNTKTKTTLSFDDRSVPPNNLTVERIKQIEEMAMPIFDDLMNKLQREKPDLFRSPRKP